VKFNPFDRAYLQDPYPTYARLRDEAPVTRVRIPPVEALRMVRRVAKMRRELGHPGLVRTAWQTWRARDGDAASARPGWQRGRPRLFAVARHADVNHVLRSPEIFSSNPMGGGEHGASEEQLTPTEGSLIGLDPPEHGAHRAIVNRGFTPRRIAALEPRIRKIAEELVGEFEGRGSCDLVAEFANPLPVAVIAELLGLEPERRADFKRWSTALIIGTTQIGTPPDIQLLREFREYMSGVVELRRREPGDDLISLLVHAEEEGGILENSQVIGFASLLLAAGSETTTNAVGNALLALQAHPDQDALLRDDPVGRIPRLVEETLRYDPPIQLVMRATTRATELCGVEIPKHALVLPLLGAANRDPAVFAEPDRFDITRDNQAHLGFGFGNHFCLGASLARLEAAIALETIFERLPDWRIDAERTPRHGSWLVRGPTALPLRF
jgi:cytochrome P450